MHWYDPINWNPDDRNNGIPEIEKLYQHFKLTLDAAQFSHIQAVKEWVNFQQYISTSLPKHTADRLWSSTFKFKRREFPNLCILAELIIAISGSNSSVERAFSLLTRMLSDQRLSINHATLNMCLSIKINDPVWSELEREQIIDRVVDIFMEKWRYVALDDHQSTTDEPPSKRQCGANELEHETAETSESDEESIEEESYGSEDDEENWVDSFQRLVNCRKNT